MFSDSSLQKILGQNFKYFYLLKFRFKSATTYKSDTFLWFCGTLLELCGLVFVWFLNNQNGSQINFPQIFTYLVIGRIIDSFTSIENVFWFGNQLAQNRGDSVRVLMLPHDTNGVFLYLMAKYLGSNLFYSVVNIFWLTLLCLVFHSWIILPVSFVNLLWLPIFILLTFFIKFFLNFCIGMIALWTKESGGVWNLFGGINRFLSGSMFPLNFSHLTSFALYLPFSYTYFYPINLYFQDQKNIWLIFGGGVFWAICLYFLARLILKLGLKKNESVGL